MGFSETHTLMLSTWKIAGKMLVCYTTSIPSSQGVEQWDFEEQVEEKAHPKRIIEWLRLEETLKII